MVLQCSLTQYVSDNETHSLDDGRSNIFIINESTGQYFRTYIPPFNRTPSIINEEFDDYLRTLFELWETDFSYEARILGVPIGANRAGISDTFITLGEDSIDRITGRFTGEEIIYTEIGVRPASGNCSRLSLAEFRNIHNRMLRLYREQLDNRAF